MEEKSLQNIHLSRYFRRNTTFVANMCEKCYKDCNDVKIVSVNTSFLRQIKKPPERDLNDCKEDEDKTEQSSSKYFRKQTKKGKNSKNCNNILKIKEEQTNICFCKVNFEEEEDDAPTFSPNFVLSQPDMLDVKNNIEIPKFIPPKSPHNLIEESLYDNPWGLLVATIFLNKTTCMCARPCIEQFLTDYPNALAVLKSKPEDFEKYFHNIGLKKRSLQIWRMSYDFVYKEWRNVSDLYGIGKYGEDAFKMFVLGDFTVKPKDRFLRIYKAWFEKVVQQENGNF